MDEYPEKDIIYLDYNATTNIHEEVRKEMEPYINIYFGNPSSSHKFGIQTKKGIVKARSQIAKMINYKNRKLIYIHFN